MLDRISAKNFLPGGKKSFSPVLTNFFTDSPGNPLRLYAAMVTSYSVPGFSLSII